MVYIPDAIVVIAKSFADSVPPSSGIIMIDPPWAVQGVSPTRVRHIKEESGTSAAMSPTATTTTTSSSGHTMHLQQGLIKQLQSWNRQQADTVQGLQRELQEMRMGYRGNDAVFLQRLEDQQAKLEERQGELAKARSEAGQLRDEVAHLRGQH